MSFYGNIINYLTKAFKTVKIGDNTFTAEIFEDEADLTEALQKLLRVSVEENNDSNDNKLQYYLKQNGINVGVIDIPRDLLLKEGSVETLQNNQVEGYPAGRYLKLIFRTEESAESIVYINVNELFNYTFTYSDGNLTILGG